MWTSLKDKMILPLSKDDVLVIPFDTHNHVPKEEQISMLLGFDGITHVVSELISQKMITGALERLLDNHQPFSFGIINIDNFNLLAQKLGKDNLPELLDAFEDSLSTKIGSHDLIEPLNENEFAILLECEQNIQEIFPNLLELSSLSQTPLNVAGKDVLVEFSAGYVLVTDPFITAKEVLAEATSMMYKSKNEGKNGYSYSNLAKEI